MRHLLMAAALALGLAAATTAWAGWVKIDDCQSYPDGSRVEGAGSNAWTMEPNYTRVGSGIPNSTAVAHFAPDPIAGAGNQVAQLTIRKPPVTDAYNYNIHRKLGTGNAIADGTTGTLFFRMAMDTTGDQDWCFGFTSQSSAIYGYGGADSLFNGFLRLTSSTLYNWTKVNAATDLVNSDRRRNAWLDFWFVIDNAANKFSVYELWPGQTTPVLLTTGSQTLFNFNATATDGDILGPIFQFRNTANIASLGYFDDIYVDSSGQNLTDPTFVEALVPEPVAFTLLLLGMPLIVRRRA